MASAGASLSVDGLFTAGLGFDLVGAYLLGRAVFADLRSLAMGSTWKGVAVRGYVMVADRVDAARPVARAR